MNSHSIVFVSLFAAAKAFAATPLIDANTRNGSFESGVTSPWLDDLQVVEDPVFASHGGWYAILQAMPPAGLGAARNIGFQFLQASPNDGRTFIATFDARIGTTG